jgi:hypothetical protein
MGNCWPAQYGLDDVEDGAEPVIESVVAEPGQDDVELFLELVGGDGTRLRLWPADINELVRHFGEAVVGWIGRKIVLRQGGERFVIVPSTVSAEAW